MNRVRNRVYVGYMSKIHILYRIWGQIAPKNVQIDFRPRIFLHNRVFYVILIILKAKKNVYFQLFQTLEFQTVKWPFLGHQHAQNSPSTGSKPIERTHSWVYGLVAIKVRLQLFFWTGSVYLIQKQFFLTLNLRRMKIIKIF